MAREGKSWGFDRISRVGRDRLGFLPEARPGRVRSVPLARELGAAYASPPGVWSSPIAESERAPLRLTWQGASRGSSVRALDGSPAGS
jgi:hypothetical protein